MTLQPGGVLPHPFRHRRPRRRHRTPGGVDASAATTGRRFVVLRPTLADVVLKMPAGRTGDLPQGPRRHPHRRRHRPRHAGARGGCRVGRAVDGAAAGRGRRRGVRGPRRLRRRGAGQRGGVDGAPTRRTASEQRDVYEGIDERDLDRVVLDLPEPWRALGPASEAMRPGRDPSLLPAVDHPGGLVARRHGIGSRSGWRRPSRSCAAPGTWRSARSGPTTAWWRTPGSSPRPTARRPDEVLLIRADSRPGGRRRSEDGAERGQPCSMKMHSPGHSSAASVTASSRSSGTRARPAEPPGSFLTWSPSLT